MLALLEIMKQQSFSLFNYTFGIALRSAVSIPSDIAKIKVKISEFFFIDYPHFIFLPSQFHAK